MSTRTRSIKPKTLKNLCRPLILKTTVVDLTPSTPRITRRQQGLDSLLAVEAGPLDLNGQRPDVAGSYTLSMAIDELMVSELLWAQTLDVIMMLPISGGVATLREAGSRPRRAWKMTLVKDHVQDSSTVRAVHRYCCI